MYSIKSEFTIKAREVTDKEDAPSRAKSLVNFTSLKNFSQALVKNEMTAFLRFENTKYTNIFFVFTEILRMLMYVNERKIMYGRGDTIHTKAKKTYSFSFFSY